MDREELITVLNPWGEKRDFAGPISSYRFLSRHIQRTKRKKDFL